MSGSVGLRSLPPLARSGASQIMVEGSLYRATRYGVNYAHPRPADGIAGRARLGADKATWPQLIFGPWPRRTRGPSIFPVCGADQGVLQPDGGEHVTDHVVGTDWRVPVCSLRGEGFHPDMSVGWLLRHNQGCGWEHWLDAMFECWFFDLGDFIELRQHAVGKSPPGVASASKSVSSNLMWTDRWLAVGGGACQGAPRSRAKVSAVTVEWQRAWGCGRISRLVTGGAQMTESARLGYLRFSLRAVGVFATFGYYPLTLLWPSGWVWHSGQSEYLPMIVAIYAVMGVFLVIAARDPERHVLMVSFVIWSSIAHGALMAFQAVQDPHHMGHLYGDVPALIVVGAALAFLSPRAFRLPFTVWSSSPA